MYFASFWINFFFWIWLSLFVSWFCIWWKNLSAFTFWWLFQYHFFGHDSDWYSANKSFSVHLFFNNGFARMILDASEVCNLDNFCLKVYDVFFRALFCCVHIALSWKHYFKYLRMVFNFTVECLILLFQGCLYFKIWK